MAASKASAVDLFLNKLNLEKYCQNFHSHGYETAVDLFCVTERELEQLQVKDAEERAKILSSARDIDIHWWLVDLGLPQYIDEFRREGIITMEDLKLRREVTTDVFLKDALSILPGHRKRVKREANFLRSHEANFDEVVAGYWGQPPEMTETSHKFIIVPGYLKSGKGKEALSSELIQFTVDSGSEVAVTANDHLISHLQLEYLQNIESRGVHAAESKPIYRGVLQLGQEEVAVEVMPDRFCTVGSPVMKKFRHDIDETTHRWFKERQ